MEQVRHKDARPTMEQVRHKDARPTMDLVPILGKME